ncbi:cobalamin-dependent protein [Umezawaea sp. Da 62-37]|uniref:cobalamin B12-binding domain-containing protein n=1 Tax=Umezawaea sp. Da 62-37 TaxID=3075927 RepID=UPI0028F7376D|nr:cobalamin-dependent protein [Umezawaea sp. Da 62-37]WNV92121.1 cobalamin-dependent protein [Umezawaea sp. Da 62-37]
MTDGLPIGAFDDALSTVDAAAAVAVVRGLLDDGVDPLTVLVDVIARGQRAVGDRWQRGEWTVAKEHAATAVAISATEAVARFAERVPVTRGKVVVACAEREWHALPAMIIGTAIRLDGWDTVLLGASTSPARLSQCLHDLGPDATAVSCSVLGALPTTRRFIEASTTAGVPIMVGGSAFGSDDVRARALGATAWAPHAQGAVDELRRLPPVVRRAAPLPKALMAEQSAIEVGHQRLVQTLRDRWSATTSDGPASEVAREVPHQAVHAVCAALLTGDPRPLAETSTWIDRLLTARGADPRLAAELGDVLATTLRDYPAAHALVLRHWTEGLVPQGGRAR